MFKNGESYLRFIILFSNGERLEDIIQEDISNLTTKQMQEAIEQFTDMFDKTKHSVVKFNTTPFKRYMFNLDEIAGIQVDVMDEVAFYEQG